MKRALVIGATGGIGAAIVEALKARGTEVVGLSRSRDGLDITDDASVTRIIDQQTGHFDLVLVATGALEIDGAQPEKTIKTISAKAMMDQFALNAVGPALVMRHIPSLIQRRGRAVVAVLSARVGSIGDNQLGGWISYRSAKAAVNQIVRTTSVELARTHPDCLCVALHPGTVQTKFTKRYVGRHPAVPAETAVKNLLAVLDRLTPQDTGGFFDWAGKPVPW